MAPRASCVAAVLASILTLGCLCPQAARGESELLDEILAGNQSTLSGIRTLACRMVVTTPVQPKGMLQRPPRAAEYWSSEGVSRVRLTSDAGETNSVQRDGALRQLFLPRTRSTENPAVFSIRAVAPHQPHGAYDAWKLGLLKLCGPRGFPLTLQELVEGKHELRRIEHDVVDGRDLVVAGFTVQVSDDVAGEFDIWFDPKLNFLARKRIATFAGDNRRETNVLRFREVLPAVYFPEYVETRHFQMGELVEHQTVEFFDIRINSPLPSDWFELSIPGGAHVHDAIADKEYDTDSRGIQVGVARSLPKGTPLPLGLAQSAGPTSHEPLPWARWIVPGSLIVLVVGVALWIYQRWRLGHE